MLVVIALLIPQAVKIADQWERAVVLRLGRLVGIRGPGLFVIVPFIDQVAVWLDQRIQTTEINAEQALSKDTVPVNIDAVVFWQIHDPERTALEIIDYRQAITRVAQTSLREMVGSSMLSTLPFGFAASVTSPSEVQYRRSTWPRASMPASVSGSA